MRKTNRMKLFTIITIFMLLPLTDSNKITTTKNVIDEDFFKKELQNSVLEFANDLGIDPDSIYMPFRDL